MKTQHPLKILNIGRTPPRLGGSSFQNLETLVGLSNMGHNVRCISELSHESLQDLDYDLSWRETEVEVHPYEMEFIGSNELPDPEYMSRKRDKIFNLFHKLVDDEKPDVVMVGHESFAYYINPEIRAMGIPLVQVLHGTPTHSLDDENFPSELREMYLNTIGDADLIVGVSKPLAKMLNKYGIDQTTYIHNGTDTDVFTPTDSKDLDFLRELGIEVGNKVVLHASNLKPVKRPMDIVDAARITLENDPNLVYVIAGDGSLREPMQERVSDYGIEDSFRFVGRIPHTQMPQLYRNADMFLLPSEHEGFGRVVREAQACSSIPVVSNIDVFRDTIRNGDDGLLFQKGDPTSLANMINGLSSITPERREIMRKSARRTAIGDNYQRMIGDYSAALAQPRSFLEQRPAA